MKTDLFPTKTRLRLLQDVADGKVVYAPNQGGVLNLATTPTLLVN